MPPLPSYRDEDDVQVFSLSDQRLVVLDITVTNMPSDPLYPEEDGDDAHAAQLIISLPNTLSYAGSRIPEQVWDLLNIVSDYRFWVDDVFLWQYLSDLTADEMSSKPEWLPGWMRPGKPRQTKL